MRALILGSGSGGNAIVLECGDSRLLIDAGFGPRELGRRLRASGVPPESIQGLVVTHEHGDHARGAAAGAARWKWMVYATPGTIVATPELIERATVQRIRTGGELDLGWVRLELVGVSHDAVDPIAIVATDARTGARVGIAYDLGVPNATLVRACRGVDMLLLEANYDPQMLARGPYPPVVQRRIGGRQGHLSNKAAADFARAVAHTGLRQVVLAHLSETCNTPSLAVDTVSAALRRTRFRGRLTAATQDALHVVSVSAGRKKAHADQLVLF